MSEKVGAKTKLTDELFKEIKQSILAGNDLRETAKVCQINEGTLYVWHSDNYLNISDKIEGWKRDRKLMLADRNIEAILDLGISDRDSLKVVADMSKFVKETLDKKHYSKQVNSDLTTNGKQLPTPILPLNVILTDDSNNKDSEPETED